MMLRNKKGGTLPGFAFLLFFLVTVMTAVFTIGIQAHHHSVTFNRMISAKTIAETLVLERHRQANLITQGELRILDETMDALDFYSIPEIENQAVYIVAYVIRNNRSVPIWERRIWGDLEGSYFTDFGNLQPNDQVKIGAAIRYVTPRYIYNPCDVCRNDFLR